MLHEMKVGKSGSPKSATHSPGPFKGPSSYLQLLVVADSFEALMIEFDYFTDIFNSRVAAAESSSN
jgi:hypothetical protein